MYFVLPKYAEKFPKNFVLPKYAAEFPSQILKAA